MMTEKKGLCKRIGIDLKTKSIVSFIFARNSLYVSISRLPGLNVAYAMLPLEERERLLELRGEAWKERRGKVVCRGRKNFDDVDVDADEEEATAIAAGDLGFAVARAEALREDARALMVSSL